MTVDLVRPRRGDVVITLTSPNGMESRLTELHGDTNANFYSWPLTSVRQPRHLLGRTAAELLLEEATADPSHVHRQIQFKPDLVVRASSAPTRRRGRRRPR